jgi:hypothetical protein
VIARVDELLGRRIDLRAMTLLRTITGPIVILHLWPAIDDARRGFIYRDTFHEPYVGWYPELPRSLYIALLVLGALAGAAMLVKPVARTATIVAFSVVSYDLWVSTTQFHNNRGYLFIVLGVLCFVPGDEGPAWPLWLLRVEAAAVYGASGLSKLLDRDWFGGQVTWGRMIEARDHLPGWAVDTLTDRSLHTAAAKVIVLTELFIAFGLWSRRTRPYAVGVAVAFHLAIAATADVEVFSALGIAALLIWVPARSVGRGDATVDGDDRAGEVAAGP